MPFTIIFTLSNKIITQKRKVYDIWMVLGEVGGAYAAIDSGFS